jgi:DNA-directed RNA polymerase
MAAEAMIEQDCLRCGVQEYRDRRRRLEEKGYAALSKPEAHLIRTYIDPVQRGLVKWIMECRKRPGRKATALPLLAEIDGDCSALIALRVIMNTIALRPRLQDVTLEIGQAIEREARFSAFEQTNPALFSKISKHIDQSPLSFNPDYRARVLTFSANKYKIAWQEWTKPTRMAVGMAMLDIVIKETGLVTVGMVGSRRRRQSQVVVFATEEMMKWLEESHGKCEMMQPLRLPMTVEPLPHTKMRDGGYLAPGLRYPVVKTSKIGMPIDYSSTSMPRAFDALNKLQSVAYSVNERVREVAVKMWEMSVDLPKAARRADIPLPPKPKTKNPKSPAMLEYKQQGREIFYKNRSERGKRLAVSNILAVANRMKGRPIWFPLKFDFRSRIYCQPNYLTPQGSDLAKGLLTFADAVPLGEHGLKWLMIHAANCFGIDKVSFAERVDWVSQNLRKIRAVAAAPMTERWWTEADQPFQFLAACFELADIEVGADTRNHLSRLPVTVDGSCNGIQHLSALSLDASAGAEVNLIPLDKPADIYARVAAETIRRLKEIECSPTPPSPRPRRTASATSSSRSSSSRRRPQASTPRSASRRPSPSQLAKLWLGYGVGRKMCKRPTMIMPYNGTLSAVEKYINAHLNDALNDDGVALPSFGKNRAFAVRFLAKVMWDAINTVAPGPRLVMQWTRALAAAYGKSGRPFIFTTPADFVVKQAYAQVTGQRVKTKLGDTSVKLTLVADTDKLDPRRQAQALAPNWIHSLDAAALQLTVLRMWELGIRAMVAVHDSYGTHAGHVETLSLTLREVFADVYSHDVLGSFVAELQAQVPEYPLPAPPPKGTLDIALVKDSPYFFA